MVAFKAFSALAAMAFGATLALALPGFSPQVEASTSAPSPVLKRDRLDVVATPGTDCSRQAWPYFETRCLRDARQASGQARVVRRIIAIDNKAMQTFDLAGK